MKKLISMMLVMMMVFSLSMAFAKTVEPGSTRINHLAGATVNATVGAYNQDTKTFTVTVYDCDRYDSESTAALETGDTVLAGGDLYRITGSKELYGSIIYECEGGEEIDLENAYDYSEDLIVRSTMDDRIFMNAVTVLHLPVAEGIIFEDNSDPDLDAEIKVYEGLEEILKIQAEKEETSNGLNYYATSITLDDQLEIVKIRLNYDVAQ